MELEFPSNVTTTTMNPAHQQLWNQISDFEFGDPDARLGFVDRLARENGWSLEYASRVSWEYKRFLFLCCVCKHSVTPSDQVDQAWHLHLLYTESYWVNFCRNTIGRDIHHGPTKGGNAEGNKFKLWYEKTLESYRKYFHTEPPADIWPDVEKRFSGFNYRRIDLDKFWIFPKPKLRLWKLLSGIGRPPK
ncbi:MAG: glycine-rich domain-containing protein [Saprospiraceae bacterium]